MITFSIVAHARHTVNTVFHCYPARRLSLFAMEFLLTFFFSLFTTFFHYSVIAFVPLPLRQYVIKVLPLVIIFACLLSLSPVLLHLRFLTQWWTSFPSYHIFHHSVIAFAPLPFRHHGITVLPLVIIFACLPSLSSALLHLRFLYQLIRWASLPLPRLPRPRHSTPSF